MAVSYNPIFPQSIKNAVLTFVNADGTATKDLITAGTNGSKVELLTVASTDTADRDMNLYVTISAVAYLLTTVKIPLTSGFTNALPAIDVLRHTQIPGLVYDSNGNRVLFLASGSKLSIAMPVAVTAAKTITLFTAYEDF